MKKLLFVISQLYRGGAETSLVNLLNNLDQNKYKVDFVILDQYPVKDAISLVNNIPNWINVCDAYSRRKNIFSRLKGKIMYSKNMRNQYYSSSLRFVENKVYDWAFFVGEWYNPEFVATHVRSHKKAAWIHSDISKADYFNSEQYFQYFSFFDKYIFVSENSLKSSCKMYKFLEEKANTIYNISDTKKIKLVAGETVDDYEFGNKPTLVTCANIRGEKNHIRQVEAMKLLKERGVDFSWVNVGMTSDKEIVSKIKRMLKEYKLEEDFLILGPKNNPYKYINHADAVTVLSDHESWSMVITEAKILGTPVIATKTSGALEQIENEVTGMLTDFSVEEIADTIEKFIKDKNLQETIRKNISNFDNTKQILDSFDELVYSEAIDEQDKTQKNKILYVIDDINYLGGAHIATKYQISKLLEKNENITIFSASIPKPAIRNELLGAKFISCQDLRADNIFNMRLLQCLINKHTTVKEKVFKIKLSYYGKILRDYENFDKLVLPQFDQLFSNYDVICVMSEGSLFKESVSKVQCKKKIQWIHIDYCNWKDKTQLAKKLTKNDSETWRSFDEIIVLTDNIKDSFSALYPHLKDKVKVMANIMPVDIIKRKANTFEVDDDRLKFITVGRVDKQKAYERLIPVLVRLKSEGYKFCWTVIGDGGEMNRVKNMLDENKLEDVMFMEGAKSNPFPNIKQADVFALLSDFEGLPNTIYEALILGTPVIATNVGGVRTQVINQQTGWLVENDSESIYRGIKHILDNPHEVQIMKDKLKGYKYDNEKIYADTYKLFLVE